MAASTYLNQVQQLYIAYFGRPADPIGQQYWAQVIDSAGGNISSVLAGFSASTESTALYGTLSTAQKVAAIYSSVFNRAPEAAGLAYWINQIDSGTVTQAQAAWAIQQAAGPGDASTVNNKLIAANAFTANLDTSAEITGYSGANAAAVARAFLDTVDSTYQSIANVTQTSEAALAEAVGAQPTPTPTPTPIPPIPPIPPVQPPLGTFSATEHAGVVTFSGTATGIITVKWNGIVGTSKATFSRGEIDASPIDFGAGKVSSVTLAADQKLHGYINTLEGLTTSGAGSVELWVAGNVSGKTLSPNTKNDVMEVFLLPEGQDLRSLTGFETINLHGGASKGITYIADGAGTVVNGWQTSTTQLGAGGQTFKSTIVTVSAVGGTGNDTFFGGLNSNTYSGGAGNDTFFSNSGSETLSGDEGDDTFVINGLTSATNGSDVITDFMPAADKIQFNLTAVNAVVATQLLAGGLNAINFISGSGAVATTANQHFIYDTNTGSLKFDPDGSGSLKAEALVTLMGKPLITAADIVLV